MSMILNFKLKHSFNLHVSFLSFALKKLFPSQSKKNFQVFDGCNNPLILHILNNPLSPYISMLSADYIIFLYHLICPYINPQAVLIKALLFCHLK